LFHHYLAGGLIKKATGFGCSHGFRALKVYSENKKATGLAFARGHLGEFSLS